MHLFRGVGEPVFGGVNGGHAKIGHYADFFLVIMRIFFPSLSKPYSIRVLGDWVIDWVLELVGIGSTI